jgi:hypothetical protein
MVPERLHENPPTKIVFIARTILTYWKRLESGYGLEQNRPQRQPRTLRSYERPIPPLGMLR